MIWTLFFGEIGLKNLIEGPLIVYDLFSICNHTGGLNGGHYYSYCKNQNNKWYEFNDERVKEISQENIITNNASKQLKLVFIGSQNKPWNKIKEICKYTNIK